MPIVHWNRENAELKDFLKEKNISYAMISKYLGYTENTVAHLMRKPLNQEQYEMVMQAIKKLVKSPDYLGEPVCMNYDADIKVILRKNRITQAEIAKRMFVSNATMSKWVLNPTPQRRCEILEIIENIREERRLSI